MITLLDTSLRTVYVTNITVILLNIYNANYCDKFT